MSFKYNTIDYLICKKIKISNELIQYHKAYSEYLKKNNNIVDNKRLVPKYKSYVNFNISKPTKELYIGPMYELMEGALDGIENCIQITYHNYEKIRHLMFRLDLLFVVMYVFENEIIGIRQHFFY